MHTQLDEEDEDDEGLATLIPEIQETALLVEVCFIINTYLLLCHIDYDFMQIGKTSVT